MKYMRYFKLIILLLILAACDNTEVISKRIRFQDCSALHTERMEAKEVQLGGEFDEWLNSFYQMPLFDSTTGYYYMVETLRDMSGPYNVTISCLEENALHFSISTETGEIKGFYRIVGEKYRSGPFSDKIIKAIIVANPNSGLLKKAPTRDNNKKDDDA
ncbi:hypothetical protein FLL45_22615 [Aliikangiella marina]|uniref:Lipoprotein n=1 Tax=Aliikangiella marina TaxID=1712262 RepID=A0A545T1N3_9GAMM|nr:hypothetical protein [Aliikangiella marina]TQV71123.1 hypothetical protein FLL45_22615 [Aliikangiella marina]